MKMPCKLQSAVAPFIQDMISWEKLDLMDCIVVSGEPLHQDLPPFLKSGNGKRITSKTDVVICSIDGLYQPDTLWGKVYHARLLEMNASIMASETHHPKPTVAPIEIKGCGGSMLAAKLQLSMAIAANIKRFEKLGVDAEAFVGLHVAAGGWYIILAESGGAEMVVVSMCVDPFTPPCSF